MGLSCWFPDTHGCACVGPRQTVSWIFEVEPDGCIAPRWSEWFIRLIKGKIRLSDRGGHSACFAEVELAQQGDAVSHVHRLVLHRLPLLPSGYIDSERLIDQIRNLLAFRIHFDRDDPGFNAAETQWCELLGVGVQDSSPDQVERDRARVMADLWVPTAAQIARVCELVNRRAGQPLLTAARFRSEFAAMLR